MEKEALVICPVYNEQVYIKDFYLRLRNTYKGKVLFVDDGSTDTSREFLLEIKNKDTFVIRHSKRRGYGAALISGFEFALDNRYRIVVTMDVDLQHRPEQLPNFLNALRECEVVLGSRYIKITNFLDAPRSRITINRYISKLIKILFSVEFTDPFCGFRGYRDSFLKKVHLTELSYGIGLEILLEIIRTETVFIELPVEAIYFKDARKFLDGLDDPRKRLLYYLGVISRKRSELANEKKIFSSKSTS